MSTFNPMALRQMIHQLPVNEQANLLELLEELEEAETRNKCQDDFIEFVRHVWPNFIEGPHHRLVADAFNEIARGEIKRLMVFMPPRHTKSEFASYLLPAWFFGNFPRKKIIQASNNAELAVGFGRKVRNLVNSDTYQQVFPDVSLSGDSKAAGRWNTNKGGEYFAVGVSGILTGRGADLLIIDDPHSEQEAALNSVSIYNNAYEWYTSGPRQRLQPGGAIVMVVTRWSKIDLPGQILRSAIDRGEADEWKIIELPAILDEYSENERPVWPGFWTLKELDKVRQELPVSKWQAQYQQKPTSEEGAIIKREWWNDWSYDNPPDCEFVIQCWDTALTAKETSDFSACSTWGVFYDDKKACIILLDAYKARIEFPELKKKAIEKWREYRPDAFIVEAKASGAPLIQELRRLGIPVGEYTPASHGGRRRGSNNDKVSRMNSISDIFSSGHVYAPKGKRWADELMEDCAEFPFGESDDLVDTMIMALMRFREGGFITLDSDDIVADQDQRRRRVAAYY